jgi:hypothetical protein
LVTERCRGFGVVPFQWFVAGHDSARAARRRFASSASAAPSLPAPSVQVCSFPEAVHRQSAGAHGRQAQFPFSDERRHFPAQRQQTERRFRAVLAFVYLGRLVLKSADSRKNTPARAEAPPSGLRVVTDVFTKAISTIGADFYLRRLYEESNQQDQLKQL